MDDGALRQELWAMIRTLLHRKLQYPGDGRLVMALKMHLAFIDIQRAKASANADELYEAQEEALFYLERVNDRSIEILN